MSGPQINKPKGEPYLPNQTEMQALGFNEKGKFVGHGEKLNFESIKQLVSIMDANDAFNRFTYYNLPEGMDAHMIERVLFYRGEGAFTRIKIGEGNYRYVFLPYALESGLDLMGRDMKIRLLPFRGPTVIDYDAKNLNKSDKELLDILTEQPKKVLYDVLVPETPEELFQAMDECAVIIHDYSPKMNYHCVPRASLNRGLNDAIAACIPFMMTALAKGSGISAMRVPDPDAGAEVVRQSAAIVEAALNQVFWIPMTSTNEFQELTGESPAKVDEYSMAMQTLTNFRLSTYGIENGGLMAKKEHILQDEQDFTSQSTSLTMQDALKCRQTGFDIINSIWQLGTTCEMSEMLAGVDRNLDGELSDQTEGQEAMDGSEY